MFKVRPYFFIHIPYKILCIAASTEFLSLRAVELIVDWYVLKSGHREGEVGCVNCVPPEGGGLILSSG